MSLYHVASRFEPNSRKHALKISNYINSVFSYLLNLALGHLNLAFRRSGWLFGIPAFGILGCTRI